MPATAKYNSPQWGADPVPTRMTVPVAASTTIYGGTMVAINTAGYAVPAASTPGLRVLGRAEDTVSETTGVAGAVSVNVARGCFRFANASSTGALTSVDVGKQCFVSDDITVTRLSTGGTTPIAGRVMAVDSSGVWVDLMETQESGTVDLFITAGADLSSSQFLLVKNSSGSVVANDTAGGDCLGVLQNAPANAAIAIVRAQGPSRLIASTSINANVRLASTNAGKSKVAVAGSTNTSDAGVAADPLVGSFVIGLSLTAGTTDTAHSVLVQMMGAIPTTAA